jgi:cold shock CspA family protein
MTTGVVVDFDDRKGWGTVRAEGGAEHFFHCTAVADGTRMILVGAEVSFDVIAGRCGRWEATALRSS